MNKIEEQFIPYESALELKELGFDEECFGYYIESLCSTVVKLEIMYSNYNAGKYITIPEDFHTNAPLWQQSFNWFREVYSLHSTITSVSQESWQWHIQMPHDTLDVLWDEDFSSYEEASLECLKTLIEIVKQARK